MPETNTSAITVENLQRYLRQLAYHNPGMTSPPVDGIFGSTTEQSLREFQRANGLPVTGRANQQTWELLYSAYRASRAEHAPPTSVAFFPYTVQQTVMTLGRSGFAVTVLQYMLRELGVSYDFLEGQQVTGDYDTQTQTAVRTFQRANAIPASGNTDAVTWNSIADQYNVLFRRDPYL